VSEALPQGPYVAARVGFEPAALLAQDSKRTTEPPSPTSSGKFHRRSYFRSNSEAENNPTSTYTLMFFINPTSTYTKQQS